MNNDIMSIEEFENSLHKMMKFYYFGVTNKYKSAYRAIRRGHALTDGSIVPKRPFNNRANTSKRPGVHSRTDNEIKKIIYGNIEQQRRNHFN